MPVVRPLFSALLTLVVGTQAHAGLVLTEEAGPSGLACLKMIAVAARGNAARSDLHYMYTPFHGYHLSRKAAQVMHVVYIWGAILDHALSYASLGPVEMALIKKMRFSVAQENRMQNVRFVSAKSHPEVFGEAGVHRIAVTGDKVGDPIWIDSDQIESLSYTSAISLLIHEFAHHHGIKDDELRILDQLGNRVAESFATDSHRLDSLGLPNFEYTHFGVGLNQTMATTIDEAYGIGVPHYHDHHYGSQVVVSDGEKTHDLRELLRLKYSPNQSLISLNFKATGWRIDETRKDFDQDIGRALVVEASVKIGMNNDTPKKLELVLPLDDRAGVWRFRDSATRYPYIVEVAGRDESVMRFLWNRLGFNPVDQLADAQNVRFDEKGGRTWFEAEFDGNPELKVSANPRLFWVQDIPVPGGLRTLVPADHPLANVPRSDMELDSISPGRFRIRILLPDDSLYGGSIKLAGIMLFQNSPNNRLMLVPEVLPVKTYTSKAQSFSTLLHTATASETGLPSSIDSLTMSLSKNASRDFRLAVQVPADFPVKDYRDFVIFDRSLGGSVMAVFEDPNLNLASYKVLFGFGPSMFLQDSVWFRVRHPKFRGSEYESSDPKLGSETSAVMADGGDQGRIINVPMRMSITTQLMPEYVYSPKPLEPLEMVSYSLPAIRIKGFVFRSADLRSWYLPMPMEFNNGQN